MYASLRMYVPSLPTCAANTDVGRVERAQGLESAGPSVGRFKVVLTRESLRYHQEGRWNVLDHNGSNDING